MAKNLVIVESPAKAKTIKKFLGKTYTVDATMGHLIDMPKSSLGVDVDNDYDPKYMFFFSAKKRRLSLSDETGKFIEQQMLLKRVMI